MDAIMSCPGCKNKLNLDQDQLKSTTTTLEGVKVIVAYCIYCRAVLGITKKE